jgi:Glucodextranase, domain N
MNFDGSAAFGKPGVAPTWTSSAKDRVITALGSSRPWATIGHGILNEVYWLATGQPLRLGMHGVRFDASAISLQFTRFFPDENRWEGSDYQVALAGRGVKPRSQSRSGERSIPRAQPRGSKPLRAR